MMSDNFYDLLRARFQPAIKKPFLTLPDGRNVTYGEIDALSAKMAGALVGAGARPGDRVLVQVEKSPENIALYIGALRAGLIYVPLNTAYTGDEVSYFLKDAEPAIFFLRSRKRNCAGVDCEARRRRRFVDAWR